MRGKRQNIQYSLALELSERGETLVGGYQGTEPPVAKPDPESPALRPNSVEPPWYGPVCPVVWEGRHREMPPYPDQLPVRLGDVVLGSPRVGGRAVESAGSALADGVVRPPLAPVPVGIQRVGPGAPAVGVGHDGACGNQQCRDFDDVGSWVHWSSSLLSDPGRRPPQRRPLSPGRPGSTDGAAFATRAGEKRQRGESDGCPWGSHPV